MSNPLSNRLIGWLVFGGILFGMLLGWLLPGRGLSSSDPTPESSPTSRPTDPRDRTVWAVPTQPAVWPAISKWEVVKVGSTAPDFTLDDLAGEAVRLSDFRGKVVVINFWASWCPPCKKEMPDLQRIADENADGGLVVIGINTAYIDVHADALAFIDQLDLTFPIIFDETGEVGEQMYSVVGLPTSFWIDRQGIVRQIQIGAMSRAQMDEQVDRLLLGE